MRKEWTESDVNFLIEYYPNHGRKYCGGKLNRTIESVRRKAETMGIKLNKEVRSEISRRGTEEANKARIIDRMYEKSINFQGYEMTVIESNGAHNLTIQFNDIRKSIRTNVSHQEFLSGSVKNLFHPDIYDVGYFGEGIYTARVNGKMSRCYTTWINMLGRCYDILNPKRQTSYNGVVVCIEWHNFQNFTEWFYENFNSETMQKWALDKDLLCFSCRKYSPETCCFLPSELNTIFQNQAINKSTGVRGVHKEGSRYTASISKFGKQYYLGVFDTIKKASDAYNTAKKDYLVEISKEWEDILPEKTCTAIKNFDINNLI